MMVETWDYGKRISRREELSLTGKIAQVPSKYPTVILTWGSEHAYDVLLWSDVVVLHIFMAENHEIHGLNLCHL